MKSAIYIEDGYAQLALTAENDFERMALKSFYETARHGATVQEGSLYHCRGGWVREGSGTDKDNFMFVAIKQRDAG